MGVETVVLFERARLPDPQAWQREIARLDAALAIDTDFDPAGFEGYLPCTRAGSDCGFEYFLDAIDADFVADLDGDLPAHWDAALVLVTRSDLADLRAAAIAAVAFVRLVDGGLVEDGDTAIVDAPAGEAWLARLLEGIAAAEADAARRGDAHESATGDTDDAGDDPRAARASDDSSGDAGLDTALAAATGATGRLSLQMGMLALAVTPPLRIVGSAWRMTLDGDTFDATRYAAVRQQQIRLMMSGSGDAAGDEAALAGLETRLDDAGEQDEVDARRLADGLGGGLDIVIVSARRTAPNHVVVAFAGDRGATGTWEGIGTSSISVAAGALRWSIDDGGATRV